MAAARVCCTCGGRIRGKQKETFFECVRCARWQHNYCLKNWQSEDPKLCDICLDEEKQQPHQWVEKLASLDFDRRCRPYSFCYLCCKHFCPRCCPATPRCRRRDHGNHRTFIILVRRRGVQLFVRLEDVNDFYDCSHIEPEIAGWVRLHPKPEEQDAGGGGGEPCGFRECNRRIGLEYDFCSIYCQFEEVLAIARDAVTRPTLQEVLRGRVQKDRVEGLLTLERSNGTPIVSLGHGWDKFCLLCHTGFSSQVCHHHDNHSTIQIIDTPEFGLVARFIQSNHGEWLASLSTVQSSREEKDNGWFGTEVIVEVPLMMQPLHPVSELRPNSCPCGSGIHKDMVYCSVDCLAVDL